MCSPWLDLSGDVCGYQIKKQVSFGCDLFPSAAMLAGYKPVPTDSPGINVSLPSRYLSADDPQKTEESCDHLPRRTEGSSEDRGAPIRAEQDAHAGVKKVQAALRIYGRYSRRCLFIGYVRSLTIPTGIVKSFPPPLSPTRPTCVFV